MIEFNQASTQHVSILLFGGELEDKEKVYAGVYKTGPSKGQVKYKVERKRKYIEGLRLNPLPDWKTKKDGIYQTNESVLEILCDAATYGLNSFEYPKLIQDAIDICSLLLEIRGIQKELSTYYESVENLVHPIDSCIHQQYQNVKTDTGRLSATKPNVQNQPKAPSKVTQHFISRYQQPCTCIPPNDTLWCGHSGKRQGKIIIADYKSLEPRVEAELCQDPQLMLDVENEVDVHTKNLSLAEHVPYEEAVQKVETDPEWKGKRSFIKGFTFAQQYLASVKTTAKNSGLSEQEVKDILEARRIEYSRLYEWHEENQKEVDNTGSYSSPLGRKFFFKKYPANNPWQAFYYSRNDVANYRSQGTGWDVAGIMIGRFWREKALHNRDKYVMINTVHDNLMLDVKEEYVEQAKKDLKLLEDWKETCYNKFKYRWYVNIKIDISMGDSWYNCN